MNIITEYQKIVNDAKIELDNLGVVKNYDTARKCENLNRLISKYEQYIMMLKKYGKII